MKYIQIDGQLFGTGLYTLEGIPIETALFHLSLDTENRLNEWLLKYRSAIFTGFKEYSDQLSNNKLIDLDKEGLCLKTVIQQEIQQNNPDIFLTYWSEALGEHLNDSGGIIQDWRKMVGLSSEP